LSYRLILMGSIALGLGMLAAALGATIAGQGANAAPAAQQACPSPDPTPDPTVELRALGIQQEEDCIPGDIGPGPRLTPSVGPTSTPEPALPEPTVPAPTETPLGGAGAPIIAPPNTGSGPRSTASLALPLLWGVLVLTLAGAGFVAAGVRRRI